MINFGVIGAGNIANTFCLAVNNSVANAKLYAIASRSLEKAKEYQEKYGFTKAYDNYVDLFKDQNIDIIYVATPHGLHYEQMMEILDYNKHILCEKSFTLNAKQAEAVFNKAKEKNLFVMEAMWTRFLPVIRQLQKEVSNGVIGDVIKVQADFCFKASASEESRLFNIQLGGGALLDVGIYPITFANIFMGKPKSIFSTVEKYHTGVDITEEIIYIYEHGKACLKASLKEDEPMKAKIIGTKGYIDVNQFFFAEEATIYDLNNHIIMEINIPHQTNGFEYEIKEVIDCIENDQIESTIMSHNETLEILKQMDYLRTTWGLTYPQEKL